MELFPYLRKLFTYDTWANREVVRALADAGKAPQRSVKLMGHVVSAEWLWLFRIIHEPQKYGVWEDMTLEDLKNSTDELAQVWVNFFEELKADSLNKNVSYKNSKGEQWSNNLQDILMHVVMHSAYHRGQVAADMRAHGLTPVYTDFIHGVRQNLV